MRIAVTKELASVERVDALVEHGVARPLPLERGLFLGVAQVLVVVVVVRHPLILVVVRLGRDSDVFGVIAHKRNRAGRHCRLRARPLQADALRVAQVVLTRRARRLIGVHTRRPSEFARVHEIPRLEPIVLPLIANFAAVIGAEEQNLRFPRADAVKAQHEHRDPKRDENDQKQNIRAFSPSFHVLIQLILIAARRIVARVRVVSRAFVATWRRVSSPLPPFSPIARVRVRASSARDRVSIVLARVSIAARPIRAARARTRGRLPGRFDARISRRFSTIVASRAPLARLSRVRARVRAHRASARPSPASFASRAPHDDRDRASRACAAPRDDARRPRPRACARSRVRAPKTPM